MINITPHKATPQQLAAGVIDLHPDDFAKLRVMLYFDSLPDTEEIETRAQDIAELASIAAKDTGASAAMIDGPAWLLNDMVIALSYNGFDSVFAYYDGAGPARVHAGFIPA